MSRFLSPTLQALAAYVPGEQPQDRRYIKLNTNESPYPPSPRALAAVDRARLERLRLYSDPAAAQLNQAIAKRYGVGLDQVITSNGSDEILAFVFFAYGTGRPIAFPDITYGFYPVFAQLCGAQTRVVPLRADLSLCVEDYLVPGEHVLFANPNAPTGLSVSLTEIERILKAHPDDVVVVDEAYVDFGGDSAAALLDQYENLLVVQTFSKSRALAGARVGFALGSPALISDLQRVRNSFNPYNVDALAQAMAAAAMEDEDYFQSCTSKIIKTREAFTRDLRGLGLVVADSRTNFVFPRHPALSGQAVYEGLRARGILTRWFDSPRIRDHVRISIGTGEDMAAVTAALKELLL